MKFQVFDFLGTPIGTPGVVETFVLMGTSAGTTDVDPAVRSTTPDTSFRWDPSAQQWIFDVSTKGLASGLTYFYRIGLNDGTHIDFQYGLKTTVHLRGDARARLVRACLCC